MINKLNASAKLYLLVFVMSIFIIGIGVYGISDMKTMSQNTQTLYADRVLCLHQLTTIRFSYAVGILSSAEQAQADQLGFKEAVKQTAEAQKTITANWKAYRITYLTPEEEQLADQASSLMDRSMVSIEKLKVTLNKEDAPALDTIIHKELYPALNPVIAKMSELIDLQVRVGGEVYKRNTELYNIALERFILLIILSLGFAIPFSYSLVRSLNYLIKDLRASNKKTTESEEKFRSLVEHAGDAIFMVAEDTSIIDVNRSACEMLGYSRYELQSMKALDVYPPDEFGTPPINWDLLRKNKTLLNERRLQRKDGSKVEVEVSRKMLADGKGYLAIVRDITERKAMELELKQLNHELEQKIESRTKMLRETLTALENSKEELSEALKNEKQLNELKSRFVTMASHEFRTPLSTILSSTFLLEKYNATHEVEKRGKHLEYIKAAVTDMKNTLEDFLSLGKLDEGLIHNQQEIISAKELVAEIQRIIDEMEHHCKEGQHIRFQHHNDLPVYIDRKIFRNILLNLISNAIKYSHDDSVIKIDCTTDTDQLVVAIEDNGIGIPEEDLEHLSDRFFRAKNASNIQGTGLGLHIVNRYLQLMNGHIEIKSRLNQGTIFTFYIPLKKDD